MVAEFGMRPSAGKFTPAAMSMTRPSPSANARRSTQWTSSSCDDGDCLACKLADRNTRVAGDQIMRESLFADVPRKVREHINEEVPGFWSFGIFDGESSDRLSDDVF